MLFIDFRLAFKLHLTSTCSKSHGRSHAHFESEYLGNGERYDKIILLLQSNMVLYIGFRLARFHSALTHSNV